MSKPQYLSAIDIGSEKVVTLIASIEDRPSQIRILGVSSVPSRGIRKSQIVDLQGAIESITDSVDAAERMAGMNISQAFVSVSGQHIQSLNSKGVVAVANPNQEITHEDVIRVIDAAKAVSLPAGKEILHIVPKNYKVDSQEGIKDPVGMSGIRLETESHIITASSTALKNIRKCMFELGIEVSNFIFSGLAASEVILTETEKELGVVLIDIGAGTTSICAYVEGSLAYSAVLPIGARHITQDIALGCRISLASAETIKLALADIPEPKTVLSGENKEDARKRIKREDTILAQDLGISEQMDSFSRKALISGIITPRLTEIFELIGRDLEKHRLFPLIPAGVVLTGGGAETVEIASVCKNTLQLPTRVGKPSDFKGMVDEIEQPRFSVSLGLLQFAADRGMQTATKGSFSVSGFNLKGLLELLKNVPKLIRSLMP